MADKYFMVASSILGFSVWNLLHVSLLEIYEVAPRVLKTLCTPEIDLKGKYHAAMVEIKWLRMGMSDGLVCP
jgi:hypothetical protein